MAARYDRILSRSTRNWTGVRMSCAPNNSGAAKVNDEKAGARLTVIEPPSTALPKIGQVGKWLAVKATNNRRGYVMAQYVQLKQ